MWFIEDYRKMISSAGLKTTLISSAISLTSVLIIGYLWFFKSQVIKSSLYSLSTWPWDSIFVVFFLLFYFVVGIATWIEGIGLIAACWKAERVAVPFLIIGFILGPAAKVLELLFKAVKNSSVGLIRPFLHPSLAAILDRSVGVFILIWCSIDLPLSFSSTRS